MNPNLDHLILFQPILAIEDNSHRNKSCGDCEINKFSKFENEHRDEVLHQESADEMEESVLSLTGSISTISLSHVSSLQNIDEEESKADKADDVKEEEVTKDAASKIPRKPGRANNLTSSTRSKKPTSTSDDALEERKTPRQFPTRVDSDKFSVTLVQKQYKALKTKYTREFTEWENKYKNLVKTYKDLLAAVDTLAKATGKGRESFIGPDLKEPVSWKSQKNKKEQISKLTQATIFLFSIICHKLKESGEAKRELKETHTRMMEIVTANSKLICETNLANDEREKLVFQNENLIKDNEALLFKIDSHQEIINHLTKNNKYLVDRVASIQDIENFMAEKEKMEMKITSLQQERTIFINRLKVLEEMVNLKSTQEKSSMKVQLESDIEDSRKEIMLLSEEISSLRLINNKLQLENKSIEQAFNIKEEELTKLMQDNKNLREENNKFLTDSNSLQLTIKQLIQEKQQIEEMLAKSKNLKLLKDGKLENENLAQQRQQLLAEINTLRGVIDRLSEKKIQFPSDETHKEQIKKLELEKKELQSRIECLQRSINIFNEEKANLEVSTDSKLECLTAWENELSVREDRLLQQDNIISTRKELLKILKSRRRSTTLGGGLSMEVLTQLTQESKAQIEEMKKRIKEADNR